MINNRNPYGVDGSGLLSKTIISPNMVDIIKLSEYNRHNLKIKWIMSKKHLYHGRNYIFMFNTTICIYSAFVTQTMVHVVAVLVDHMMIFGLRLL